MKHTPGPWHIAADADGTMITNNQGLQIAVWPPQGGTIEQCANARLIAASPDLYAMLTRLLDGVLRLPEIPPTLCALDIEQARAALAKVTT